MPKINAAWAIGLLLTLAGQAPSDAQVAAPATTKTGLEAAFPEIQRIAEAFVERAHVPGAAIGVIVNGELVFTTAMGVRDRATDAPATPDSIFRIASMTKSFTAAAILKLRDEGRVVLDDPIERYVPELKTLEYPTTDSPRITVRHLLSHSGGFPEDNPWGDRQLARSDAEMRAWMRAGIPFSTTSGTTYEYSNYGFAILGQIIARVSGQPYEKYLQASILEPLGMTSTMVDVSAVPRDRIAKGYRWNGKGWEDEELLAHGSFGSMGGLWTSARDLAKWVAFLLDGFPARDGAERGPLRRASVREMQQVWRSIRGTALQPAIDVSPVLNAGGYGYGLRISQNCAFGHLVAHGGGLPGYGSQMQWLPEYGVGLIAMGNVTYAGWGGAVNEMWNALAKTGALKPRPVVPSRALLDQQQVVTGLLLRWDDRVASTMAADNLFMDQPAAARRARLELLATRHGTCRPADPSTALRASPSTALGASGINAENALRGSWRMTCDRGWLDVSITLAPTMPPSVQYLSVDSVLPPSASLSSAASELAALVSSWDDARANALMADAADMARLRRQAELVRAQYGACRVGEHIAGDGASRATMKLSCDRGAVIATLAAESPSRSAALRVRLSQVTLSPAIEGACAAPQ